MYSATIWILYHALKICMLVVLFQAVVTAIDIAEHCCELTFQNARKNKLDHRLAIHCRSLQGEHRLAIHCLSLQGDIRFFIQVFTAAVLHENLMSLT